MKKEKTITNPKVIEAIEAAERGEVSQWQMPAPGASQCFEFDLMLISTHIL